MIRVFVIATFLLSAPADAARTLPLDRAHSRAAIAAASVARLTPLPAHVTALTCKRRSRLTVDCAARFESKGRPACFLVIRVRYASSTSNRTRASYPVDPVCQPPAAAASVPS